MKNYRVYKRVTKHNITFFVKSQGARYIPYGEFIGYIQASSLDNAADLVKTFTENGLLNQPAFLRK